VRVQVACLDTPSPLAQDYPFRRAVGSPAFAREVSRQSARQWPAFAPGCASDSNHDSSSPSPLHPRATDSKTVPHFVPHLFQNALARLATGSKSQTQGIHNKHAVVGHVRQRLTMPHCLSLEAFRATVNRRVPGSSPGRGANPLYVPTGFGV
jgi:hypothetical protein